MATHIPLNQIIDNPFQSRSNYDRETVRSLADEMEAEGFWSGTLQGRRTDNGKIELVFGHRRLRALRLLKRDAVPIEIVKLTDAQMALRSLEENLQREGLTDLEKADGVKRAVEIAREELRSDGKSESHAISQIAERLGLSVRWVTRLCEISGSMLPKTRKVIEAGHITAQTALTAKTWGGDEYVKTLASQGKDAATTGAVPKPTHMTVAAMAKAVKDAPESVRDKLKTAIVAGDVTTPAEAAQKGRRLAAERTKRTKPLPPDLETAIVGWTRRYKDWGEQIRKELIPYLSYIDDIAPAIAKPFHAAQAAFMETAREAVIEDAKASPRVIGKGRTSAAGGAKRLRQ